MTEPGTEVAPDRARVEVDGRLIQIEPKVYILLNKPRGPLSTVTDHRGRRTVLDLLEGLTERLYPAGRLDADTEGLLLITNDGELTYRLTHPRYGVEKVYEAEVKGHPSRAALKRIEQGMVLTEGPTGPARTRALASSKETSLIEITVHAGRKRMVRRMFDAIGHPVVALRRTRLGTLTLGNLKPGEWRQLTPEEINRLKAAITSEQSNETAVDLPAYRGRAKTPERE